MLNAYVTVYLVRESNLGHASVLTQVLYRRYDPPSGSPGH